MSVVETLTFRLAPGTDEGAFLEADRRAQTEFIPNPQGFMRRTTARGPDGDWLVVMLWDTLDNADASRALEQSHPAAVAFNALIDSRSLLRRRYTTLD